MEKFLSEFAIDNAWMVVCYGSPDNPKYFDKIPADVPSNMDVFFGVAARRNRGNEKKDVLGTRALWVDADDLQKPLYTLPPSIIVVSGHGYHLYWLLTEPLIDVAQIEYLNQLLAKDVPTADQACWNANRLLRVPGTHNTKNGEVTSVSLVKFMPELRYTPADIKVLEKLPKATRHKIRTGDSRGYRSRSERDWAVVTDLVAAGASDELIQRLFANHPIGDKAASAAPGYLQHTIERARASGAVAVKEGMAAEIEERSDGYYTRSRRGQRRLSTFVIQPKLLLDGSTYGAEDAIVGTVAAEGFEWRDVTFTRSAFTSVQKMDRETPVAAWQWLGSDNDVRQLLPHLIAKLQSSGLPRVVASPYLGLHVHKGVPYFLGTDGVLSSRTFWEGFTGPLAWLPSKREHPTTKISPHPDPQMQLLGALLPQLNEPDVIWIMIGWYASAACKPWLEERGYRFPVLNVVGTKGSGKTTLIQRVFLPLFGQTSPKTYDANTTRFVILSILGSANAIPVAFSEFRYESAEKFLRYVLLAYDTGHDPRGRGDQTTVDYPLMAPFSIDGEDLIADPAARERIVVAHLKPATIVEGSEAYSAFRQIRETRVLEGFAHVFLQDVLRALEDGSLNTLLEEARKEVFTHFPGKLPDRVRNNHIVNLFGSWLWCKVVGLPRISASYLNRSVQAVYSVSAGRSRTLADDLVEDVVNAASAATNSFRWEYDATEKILYFQLTPAHSWWLASRRRQGRGGLERDALKSQLLEAPYTIAPRVVNGAWMVGVKLDEAQACGLDVPIRLNVREFKVRF